MMPKKKRREITVNGVLYHYKISGCINVVIQNTETDEILKWQKEWKPKWNLSLTPQNIKNFILTGKMFLDIKES